MPVLDRNGVDIYYEVHGSGPAILLTHAYSATSQMWRGQIESLSADHTLILWDMRGHGRSHSPPDPAAYSARLTAEDMAALLDSLGFDTAVVGGLSLGGYMSLELNLAHRERVDALLIIGTGPGFKNDDARASWNDYANSFADGLVSSGLSSLADGSVEQATAAHSSVEGLVLAARHMLTQQNARVIESLPSISVPSLVLVGADDKPFLNAAEYMSAKIPGATSVVLPEAGHAANIDQPQSFNAALRRFLDTNEL